MNDCKTELAETYQLVCDLKDKLDMFFSSDPLDKISDKSLINVHLDSWYSAIFDANETPDTIPESKMKSFVKCALADFENCICGWEYDLKYSGCGRTKKEVYNAYRNELEERSGLDLSEYEFKGENK